MKHVLVKSFLMLLSIFSSQRSVKATGMAFSSSSRPSRSDVEDRLKGALWGFFAGDALSAPTHWFYGGERQVIAEYGRPISDYTQPNKYLAGSILNKSNLNGGGRSSAWASTVAAPKTIIGDVINHGKKELWNPNKSIHYHATLQKGENTLEAQIGRVLMRSIVQRNGRFDQDHFQKAYITFMTTSGSHNDTYASTCHRMFFANLVHKQLPPNDCPDNDQHNVDTIDGLVLPTIVALVDPMASSSCASTTRKSKVLEGAATYWGLLVQAAILQADDSAFQESLHQFARQTIGREPNSRIRDSSTMSACYLQQALPGMIDLLSKYTLSRNDLQPVGEKVWEGLLSNANVGGENVHRGSLMGAILGARAGASNLPSQLTQGLYQREALAKEIDDFVAVVVHLLETSVTD